MNIAPKPPLARQGQKLASHGRYGDTELVHMNPYEVQGLAAMSPTGQLTKNPVTGQPEAFLPFLAPLLGKAIGTKLLAGKVGAGLAGAIGSGLGTFAESGSLEKGLVSGITGFGLGKIFSAGADAVNAGTEMASLTSAQKGLQTALQRADVTPDLLDASKILQQPNSMVNAATLGDALGTKTSVPISYDPFEGVVGGETVTPISQSAQSLLDASQQVGTATSALDSARQGISFGDRLAAFTEPEGLRAMGQAALQPANLLTTGTGLGLRAQIEAQEDMQRRADEAAAEEEAYAQSFRNVLTDTLGMARGSNPNPYMSQYIGNYANGGLVRMANGGDVEDIGEIPTANEMLAESIGDYGLDENKRYFINPREGSAAQRQSFLKGDFKQTPPTDYRHGFEKEFQFFDFIEDRPIERYLDLFGAGPSDYLAGLLASSPERLRELGTPVAEGTQPLAQYTDTRGTPFTDISNKNLAYLDPITSVPTGGVSPASGPAVAPPPAAGVTTGGGSGPVIVDTGAEDAPPMVPDYMSAIQALGIPADQDYVRPEGRQVFDVLERYDALNTEGVQENLADYFGVSEDFVQDNLDVIAQNRATRAILDEAIEGGIEQVDPGEEAEDAYTTAEIDTVVNLIQDGQLTKSAAAEYFQLPFDVVSETYDNIIAQRMADKSPTSITTEAVASADTSPSSTGTSQTAKDAYEEALASLSNIDLDAQMMGEVFADQYGFRDDDLGFAKGGKTNKKQIMTKLGMFEMANGGLASAYQDDPEDTMVMEETVVEETPDSVSAMFDDGMGGIDYELLVTMTIEAIRGNVENADEIIEMFIDEYGVEEFRKLREAVLQSIVPNAQTEGKIVGTGGGMDDEVPGMIGENQPVAVAPDEYIVAADVVSGLGDGSSEAGADILDQMMADVRAARTGGRQPAPIDKSAVLPA